MQMSENRKSLVVSNQLEELYEHLKQAFFYPRDPFQKRMIVVLDFAMKSYIKLRMAQDEAKISMGVEILCLERAVEQLRDTPHTFEIALFGFSALSREQHRFFLERPGSVVYFILSPCMMFWSDICSDKEVARLEKRFFPKSEEEERAYRLLLKDRSPLLANYGQVGRDFAHLLDESFSHAKEAYLGIGLQVRPEALSVRAQEIPAPTHLQLLQNNLLLLEEIRKPKELDASLQLHQAPTLFRELDVLKQQIAAQKPKSVHVFAPDIERYRPSIERLFHKEQYQIFSKKQDDVPLFFSLLDQHRTRWSGGSFYDLFTSDQISRKLEYDPADLYPLLECNFIWGYDEKQRQVCLADEGLSYQASGSDVGTFISFKQQVINLWTNGELPIEVGRALGIFVDRVEKLFHLFDGWRTKKVAISEWGALFDSLYLEYFEPEEVMTALFVALKKKKEPALVSFHDAKELLRVELEEQLRREEPLLQAPILFSTFGIMRAIPADMVCLIGMQEQEFPQEDQDPYLFIEAILSARKCLYMSYQGYSFEERVALEPCRCITDCITTSTVHRIDREVAYIPKQRQEFHITSKPAREKSDIVTCRFLDRVAYSPLAPYFQETRGLYLSAYKKDSFHLPQIARRAAFLPQHEARAFFEKEVSALPLALKLATLALLEEQHAYWNSQAASLGIDPDHMLKIELAIQCEKVEEIQPHVWRVPAITLPDGTSLTGSLSSIHGGGVISFDEESKKSLAKLWPKLLIVQVLSLRGDLPLSRNCHFLKGATTACTPVTDPVEQLLRYVRYSERCKDTPSLLYPELIPQIEKELQPPHTFEESFDPYFNFFLEQQDPGYLEKAWSGWRQLVEELFVW